MTPDKDVIAYCRIGERSSHSWFVLHELLGYQRVRNYDGSWTEWGSMVGMPIEKPVAVRRLRPAPVRRASVHRVPRRGDCPPAVIESAIALERKHARTHSRSAASSSCLAHPGIRDQAPGRPDPVACHELVAVGDPEAEIQQRAQDGAGALDAGQDDAALAGSGDRGERDRQRVDPGVGVDDEAVQDADGAAWRTREVRDGDDVVAVEDREAVGVGLRSPLPPVDQSVDAGRPASTAASSSAAASRVESPAVGASAAAAAAWYAHSPWVVVRPWRPE